jgi:predicted dehydrogenase
MTTHRIGIIMNGVTGRMGTNQHLLRSIVPIIEQGGVKISPSETIMPEPILVGRNPAKLEKLCEMTGLTRMTTNVDEALADPDMHIYFDAQTTDRRVEGRQKGRGGRETRLLRETHRHECRGCPRALSLV